MVKSKMYNQAIVTEKRYLCLEQHLCFSSRSYIKQITIKQAVEEFFSVSVDSVRTLVVRGKN